jgi:hypothetical protein
MRFMTLMIPKGYESAAPCTMPDVKAVEVMLNYNESLSGHVRVVIWVGIFLPDRALITLASVRC